MPSEVALRALRRQHELLRKAHDLAGPDACTWDEVLRTLTDTENAEVALSLCLDCAADTAHPPTRECYVVWDTLWAEAGMVGEFASGYLCIGCLEQRLGRRLTRADFPDVPLNVVPWMRAGCTPRLDRLLQRRR